MEIDYSQMRSNNGPLRYTGDLQKCEEINRKNRKNLFDFYKNPFLCFRKIAPFEVLLYWWRRLIFFCSILVLYNKL